MPVINIFTPSNYLTNRVWSVKKLDKYLSVINDEKSLVFRVTCEHTNDVLYIKFQNGLIQRSRGYAFVRGK